tara:strand:- start:1878 stop:2807 length:930 start_codon:yes stop_codon:yes gene_type:complete
MNCKSILKNALESASCPNIILYGSEGVGKKHLLNEFLSYESCKKIEHTENNDYSILYTDQFCEFDIQHINRINIEHFFKTIHEYIRTKDNYGLNSTRKIILKNFQGTKSIIQNRLRVIIEKYRATTIFILITNKFTSIMEPIRSRCLCIRIPGLKNSEKRKIVRQCIPLEKRSSQLYDMIYTLDNPSDIQLVSEYTNLNLVKKYKDPILIVCLKIYQILDKASLTPPDITGLRDTSYSIAKYNLSLQKVYQGLLGIFLKDPKYTIKQKTHLVKFFSESEHIYIQSYRLLIHIESLFIQIHTYLRSATTK